MSEKKRLVEAQKALSIARRALEKIRYAFPYEKGAKVAEDALDEMFRSGPKQSLQGIVGHDKGGPRQ